MMIYLCGSQMKGGGLFHAQIFSQVKRVCSSILNKKQRRACDRVTSCRPQEQKQALACFLSLVNRTCEGIDFAEECLNFPIIKGCVNLPSFVNKQGICFQRMLAV